jgi:hypothetical protein
VSLLSKVITSCLLLLPLSEAGKPLSKVRMGVSLDDLVT